MSSDVVHELLKAHPEAVALARTHGVHELKDELKSLYESLWGKVHDSFDWHHQATMLKGELNAQASPESPDAGSESHAAENSAAGDAPAAAIIDDTHTPPSGEAAVPVAGV